MKALVLLLAIAATPAAAGRLLHAMFADHAVLQRERPIPVYGDAAPGSVVTVTLGATQAQATATPAGHWRAYLPAQRAGGPYLLEAASSDGQRQQASDVLVGDVFLCGGQSNMQLQVRAAGNAAQEMRTATDGRIRQLTVATKDSLTPLATFASPVAWTPATPTTAGSFSAACYFYARELRKTVDAPIGLVVAAWGGSRARAWASEPALRRTGLYHADLDMLDVYRTDPARAQRMWDAAWAAWWQAHGAAAAQGDPWMPGYATGGWQTAPVGLGPWAAWQGSSPDGFVGQMWMRTSVNLTAAQAKLPAVLDLGALNEEDESWINGHGVGGTSWAKLAQHPIPAGVLKPGENVVVTNVFCSWRNCGMSGPPASRAIRFDDGSAAQIAGPWLYAEVPDTLIAPQLPWGPTHGTAIDYNGMVAPMGPYGFRGAVWYQGESDMYFAPLYQHTLAAVMEDWRTQFGAGLPFLIVQLPNYGATPTAPTPAFWSDIRDAQRRAANADGNAASIVTIDIGDAGNLHPSNKQDLGRRLAIAARHLVYGQPAPAAGPVPDEVRRVAGGVTIRFRDVTGALLSYSGAPHGFELCGATQASCRFASARITAKDQLLLAAAPSERPSRVRFCWGESPVCTLTDRSGLPATPFEEAIR